MMAVNRLMPRLTVLPQTRGPFRPVVATEMLPESKWACMPPEISNGTRLWQRASFAQGTQETPVAHVLCCQLEQSLTASRRQPWCSAEWGLTQLAHAGSKGKNIGHEDAGHT